VIPFFNRWKDFKIKVVVVGIKSCKLHQNPTHQTRRFVKELRDNGVRVRSYDFSDWTRRGICIVPIEYKKTTGRIRALSVMLPPSVFILYGPHAQQYTGLITEGITGARNGPKQHTVYIDCIPTEDFDWSN
jgi:hypothetical protein